MQSSLRAEGQNSGMLFCIMEWGNSLRRHEEQATLSQSSARTSRVATSVVLSDAILSLDKLILRLYALYGWRKGTKYMDEIIFFPARILPPSSNRG